MSLSELYETGERKKDKGHFRNLVLIARADQSLTPGEKDFLGRLGRNIGLTEAEVAEIIRKPSSCDVTIPADRADRMEQIVNLIQVAQKDGSIADSEMAILNKVALALGFQSLDEIDVESIVAMVVRGEDTDVIVDDIL